jgi:hypothetical protein
MKIDDDQLHNWLYAATKGGGITVVELMGEFKDMRAGGVPLPALPVDGITCQQALERLEAAGRVVRDGFRWRWAQGKPAKAKVTQGALFG